MGTISRLCEALGLELTAEPRGALLSLETRLLRERERASRLDRRVGVPSQRLGERTSNEMETGAEGDDMMHDGRILYGPWLREQGCRIPAG